MKKTFEEKIHDARENLMHNVHYRKLAWIQHHGLQSYRGL